MRKILLHVTCILLLATAPLLLAQAVSGTFAGKIINAQDAGVPNAAVTVTNVSTNAQVKVLTGPDGGFAINNLPPGVYRIDVESQGYKHTTQENVTLAAGPPMSINITLEAGSMTEIVELRGTAVLTEPTTGNVAIGLATRTVRELPIVDRNFQQLVGLQTGVTWPEPGLSFTRDPQRNRFFSVNGQDAWNNQWQMDGLNNLEPFRNTAIRVQPVDSMKQLDAETASFYLTHGFIGGSNDTSIMPSGTNAFHGDLFEFWSGNVLRTRNFFSTTGVPAPRFVYNQPGAAGGGAIVPDKTFIYGSYQGTFANGSQTQIGTVPTPAALSGDFSGIPGLTLFNPATGLPSGIGRTPFTGNVIPGFMINPTARAIASFFPTPNIPGAIVNNYVTNLPFRNHANAADARIDQHFSDRNTVFLRYGYTNNRSYETSLYGPVIGSGTTGGLVAQNAILDWAHTMSANVIFDIRMGYNRWDQRVTPFTDQTALGFALGTPLFQNMSAMDIAGLGSIGAPYYAPERAVDNNFNWVWTWSWHTGRHDIRFGIDIRRYRVDGFQETDTGLNFGPNGTYVFGPGATLTPGVGLSAFSLPYNSLAGFLLGAPQQAGTTNFLTTPTIRQSQYAGWIGDRITLFRGLNVDLGVRYEAYSPVQPMSHGGAMFFNPVTNTFSFAGIGGNNFDQFGWNTNAWAPRIGLAYRWNDRTVIRGGYTMQYFQQPFILQPYLPTTFGSATGTTGGFTTALLTTPFGATQPAAIPPVTLVNGTPATVPSIFVPNRAKQPYVMSYNLQVQRQVPWGVVATVGYVGNVDRHLPFYTYLNPTVPGTGLLANNLLPLIQSGSSLVYGSGLTSNYNSLQIQLSKRLAAGVSFIASYTLSHALGYTTANDFLTDPFNIHNNYGPLDFDRRNIFTLSWLWELPFGRHSSGFTGAVLAGWQLNSIFTWNGGSPLNLAAAPTVCACTNFNPGVTSFSGSNAITPGGLGFLNPANFAAIGNTIQQFGRGAFTFPDTRNFDLSAFKNFHVADRATVQLRGEAFNLLNEARFALPVQNLMLPDAGQPVSTVNGGTGRQVNLALKVIF